MPSLCTNYFSTLNRLVAATEASDLAGARLSLDAAVETVIALLGTVRPGGNKAMIVGNGGSAGIASHMAIDFTKNGNLPTLAFNDGAALTCLGNDFGYEHVFARQIQAHGREGDLLLAISSSGASPSILRAVEAARERDCRVVTFSGFSPGNPLRRMGDINLYVASDQYGFVEVGHLALIHAILDLAMGWRGQVHSESRLATVDE